MSFQSLFNGLNKEQKKAVAHESGPALVLAGAGSGKTRVLIMRSAYLINEKNISPDKILLVTFTNKAALEMKNRLKKIVEVDFPNASTFHSFSARYLRKYGHYIGINNNFLIYDTQDQTDVIKSIIKEEKIENLNHNKARSIISSLKNKMISASEYQDSGKGEFQRKMSSIYSLYQKRLREAIALDFDDLLLKMVVLLRDSPLVLEKMRKQFQHVLIDEYQDTNKAQYLLSKLLTIEHKNLYVVGDFAQSIYGFRGADYKNLNFLKKDFKKIKTYYLEQNYRSVPAVLKAASCVMSQAVDCPVLDLWTDNKSKEKIKIVSHLTSYDEAKNVVQLIKQARNDGFELDEMVILYRTNSQSRIFEEELMKFGLPYQIVGGFKFYDRKEIKDVLAYVRLLVNFKDEVGLKRITKLGKRKMKKFIEWRDQFISENPDPRKLELNNHEVINKILDVCLYKEKFDENDAEDLTRLDNINELLNVSASFDNLIDFLESISLIQNGYLNKEKANQEKEGLSLMTLHSAKGLEFRIVFLVGFEEGLLPHENSLFEAKQIEEERRLCYVGITRAKEKLYLSYCQSRWTYNGPKSVESSRFLKDLEGEENLLENIYFNQNDYSHPNKKNNKSDSDGREIISDDDYFDFLLNKKIEWDD
jgi:DNA helicase-2/ATP-dependent DNA helicase PcrA